MKKMIIAAGALFVSSFAFTACNKDYVCVCRLNGTEVSRKSVRDNNRNGAEDQCNKMQSSFGVTHECRIE
ncbi:MAG: hypothetical protein BGO09_04040 [Bacteroidetes bacterium 47-18]|nr:MAG: hypothetical protein BGO09_04040 [Bacteroidetes bacterium 47-18]